MPAKTPSHARRCKCTDCKKHAADYARMRRRQRAAEEWGVRTYNGMISAERAREILHYVHDEQGVSWYEIQRVSGVSQATLHLIYHARRPMIYKRTHYTLLDTYGGAHIPRDIAPGARLPLDDYRWKILALFAQGWTIEGLREMMRDADRPWRWLNRTTLKRSNRFITYASAQSVDWLVETIGDRRGPSTLNPKRMLVRGVYPLIHYTDEGKLIRESIPNSVIVERRRLRSKHGRLASSGRRT